MKTQYILHTKRATKLAALFVCKRMSLMECPPDWSFDASRRCESLLQDGKRSYDLSVRERPIFLFLHESHQYEHSGCRTRHRRFAPP